MWLLDFAPHSPADRVRARSGRRPWSGRSARPVGPGCHVQHGQGPSAWPRYWGPTGARISGLSGSAFARASGPAGLADPALVATGW